MSKRIKVGLPGMLLPVLGAVFAFVSAPLIHFSGLNKVDDGPTEDDIERSRRLAESLRKDRT